MTISIPPGRTISLQAKSGGGFESVGLAVGGGGDDALSFLTPNGIQQGENITIATDGTNDFGTRANASPQLYMEGDNAWNRAGEVVTLEAGLAQDASISGTESTVWNSISSGFVERSFTGERANFAYRFQGGGLTLQDLKPEFENYSQIYQSGTKTTNKGFLSWKVWPSANPELVYATDYDPASLSGTFSTGAEEYLPGEDIIIDNGTQTFEAVVIHLETGIGRIHYARKATTETIQTSEVSLATITGQTSGASLTVLEDGVDAGFSHVSASASKLARFINDIGQASNPPASPDAVVAITPVSSGQHILTIAQSDAPGTNDINWRPDDTTTLPIPEKWNRYAIHVDIDQAYPKFATQLDGTIARFDTTGSPLAAVPIDPAGITLGLVINTIAIDTVTNAENFIRRYVRDFVKDDELAHVIFGDAATLATCTTTEYQRSSAWSSALVTVRQNYGDIPAGQNVYVYLFNDSGICINENSGLLIGVAP